MTEHIRVSPDGTCILITSLGSPSLAEMEQTLSRLAELRKAHGINHVLVDSRSRNDQPPVVDICNGGKLLAETLGSQVRVAVLVDQLGLDHTLFENVAVNRGADVAYFQLEESARSWLLKR
jgi:hypothetical protein